MEPKRGAPPRAVTPPLLVTAQAPPLGEDVTPTEAAAGDAPTNPPGMTVTSVATTLVITIKTSNVGRR